MTDIATDNDDEMRTCIIWLMYAIRARSRESLMNNVNLTARANEMECISSVQCNIVYRIYTGDLMRPRFRGALQSSLWPSYLRFFSFCVCLKTIAAGAVARAEVNDRG